jgi:hypothetical protein
MFSTRSDVVTARVSIAYWKRQARKALETPHDDDRLKVCFQKLVKWEEALADKRATYYAGKPREVAKPRQLPAAPDAPSIDQWKPMPLCWD